MTMIKYGMAAIGLFCGMAQAADTATSGAAQHSYHQGMSEMHDAMVAGMKETDPDIAFAKGMIAHHQGAISMAQTELKYGKDADMRKLAKEIIAAQQPEIDRMQAWLQAQKR